MAFKNLWVLGVLSVVLILLAVLFFSSGGEDGPRSETATGGEIQDPGSEEPTEFKTVALYFPSEEDDKLHPEERQIRVSLIPLDEVEQTLEELIRGSESGLVSPFPEQTEIRGLYLTEDGVVYVDFSKDIDRPELYGADAELLTIYAVVNTLTENFKPIKKVFILIDGGQMETLGGHVDLSRAFLPLVSLNAKKPLS